MDNSIGTPRRPTQHNLERERTIWAEKKINAGVVAERLRAIGKISRFYRMKNCADTITSDVCSKCEARYVVRANFCRDGGSILQEQVAIGDRLDFNGRDWYTLSAV